MFTLTQNDRDFRDALDDIVYLISSVPTIIDLGRQWVASDRNAALNLAEYVDDEGALVDHISWPVIDARYWTEFDEGADLRAAEFLVHESVPWEAIQTIVTRTEETREKVGDMVEELGHAPRVFVRRDWYF